MREIQATEAKAHLAELLRSVEHGETIAITSHGKTIANLVPAHTHDMGSREAAVDHFLQSRPAWERIGMSPDEILAARHEGRGV